MKKNIFVLWFCVFTMKLLAQQSSVSGVIAVFNSQYKTGKRQYVAKAQVEETYKKSQATTTNPDGTFRLALVGIKDLEKIDLAVQKKNYEVVNLDALHAIAGQKEWIRLWMSPEGEWAEMRLKYYQINRDALEKALTQKLQGLGQEIELLSQNKKQNQTKLQALQTEYSNLQEQFKKMETFARELAERYAKVNLDDQSQEYQEAFRHFEKGALEKALESLKQANLEKASDNIIAEQRRNKELNQEYMERDSAKNAQKQQLTDGLLFKARLHQTKFEFAKVEEAFQLLLRLDSANVLTLWDFAYFLAKQKKIHEATYYHEKALALAKTPELKATFLNNLGILYQDQNDYPKASAAYNEALTIRKRLAKINPQAYEPDIAMIQNNIGNLYYRQNDYLKAAVAYNEALEIYKWLAQTNPQTYEPDVAMTQNNLGMFYQAQNDYPKAAVALNESLEIYKRLARTNPQTYEPNVAMTQNNFGRFYIDQNDYPKAAASLNEALETYKRLARTNPQTYESNVAVTQNNFGRFYIDQNDYPKAAASLNEALEIFKRFAQTNPQIYEPDVANTQNSLGVFYKTLKKYDKALISYKEALHLREQAILKGDNHFFQGWGQVGRNISDVRDSAQVQKDYLIVVQSGQLLAESCDKLKRIHEKLLPMAVSEYGSLSWWGLFAKDYALAEKAALRCLELDKTQEWVLTNLGHSQLLRGQYDNAKTTYGKLKGKKDDENKDYKQVLLNDMNELAAEGITHKDMARMKTEIEKW